MLPSNRLGRRSAIAGAVMAFTALLSLTGPAWADPRPGAETAETKDAADVPVVVQDPVPAGFSSWSELIQAQDRLDAVAEQITATAEAAETDSGLGAIEISLTGREVHLWWKGGTPPAAVRSVVDGAARSGTPVRVFSSRYSQAELRAAADAVVAQDGVVEAGPLPDASGLQVTTSVSEESARAIPAIAQSDVPVSITPGRRVTYLFDRWNDTPAFWGGSHYTADLGCSSGFAMKGGTLLLTARHCGDTGDAALIHFCIITTTCFPPVVDPLGVFGDTYDWGDLAVIKVAPKTAAGRVYTGGPGETSGSTRVTGSQTSFKGDMVCTSGSYSGLRCSLQVTDPNLVVNVGGNIIHDLVRAAHTQGKQAARSGDSGGPVVKFSSDGTAVFARGIISGGEEPTHPVDCVGVSTLFGICTDVVLYENIKVATSIWGPVTTS